MKTAIFVEGQSEMLFVADVLTKYYNYDSSQCGFICISLEADQFNYRQNPALGNLDSQNYYQIVNVNNDSLVISKISKSINDLKAKGFDIIIGLKDVYSEAYNLLCKNNPEVNTEKIHQLHSLQISPLTDRGIDVRLHFAVMEFEAWILALMKYYARHKGLDLSELYRTANRIQTEPVEEIYHPYPVVKKLFQSIDRDYNKAEKDLQSFLAVLTWNDYEDLHQSGVSPSYSSFLSTLLPI